MTTTFWGAFIVYNSTGAVIEKGDIYSHDGRFPEQAMMRIASRHGEHCMVKFLPGVRCRFV